MEEVLEPQNPRRPGRPVTSPTSAPRLGEGLGFAARRLPGRRLTEEKAAAAAHPLHQPAVAGAGGDLPEEPLPRHEYARRDRGVDQPHRGPRAGTALPKPQPSPAPHPPPRPPSPSGPGLRLAGLLASSPGASSLCFCLDCLSLAQHPTCPCLRLRPRTAYFAPASGLCSDSIHPVAPRCSFLLPRHCSRSLLHPSLTPILRAPADLIAPGSVLPPTPVPGPLTGCAPPTPSLAVPTLPNPVSNHFRFVSPRRGPGPNPDLGDPAACRADPDRPPARLRP